MLTSDVDFKNSSSRNQINEITQLVDAVLFQNGPEQAARARIPGSQEYKIATPVADQFARATPHEFEFPIQIKSPQ